MVASLELLLSHFFRTEESSVLHFQISWRGVSLIDRPLHVSRECRHVGSPSLCHKKQWIDHRRCAVAWTIECQVSIFTSGCTPLLPRNKYIDQSWTSKFVLRTSMFCTSSDTQTARRFSVVFLKSWRFDSLADSCNNMRHLQSKNLFRLTLLNFLPDAWNKRRQIKMKPLCEVFNTLWVEK